MVDELKHHKKKKKGMRKAAKDQGLQHTGKSAVKLQPSLGGLGAGEKGIFLAEADLIMPKETKPQ